MTDTKNMKERNCGRMKIRRVNPMLKSLILGICLYAIIGVLLILLLAGNKGYYLLGFAVGIIVAVIMVVNMNMTIEETMYMGEDEGSNRGRFMYAIRTTLVVVVLIVLLVTDVGNPLLALVGLFSLKVSAYLQLIVMKIKSKGGWHSE